MGVRPKRKGMYLNMTIFDIFEPVGVFAFAISGAITAVKKHMDVFGVFILATVTALGGGVIRDVVMNRGIPAAFSNYDYYALILLAVIFIGTVGGSPRWPGAFILFDAIGLAVFTVDAGIKAIDMQLNLLSFLFMSVITGVGGGVLRDVMSKEVPVIFRREIYAVAAIAGALCLWLLSPLINELLAAYISVAVILAIRLPAVYYKLNLPRIIS